MSDKKFNKYSLVDEPPIVGDQTQFDTEMLPDEPTLKKMTAEQKDKRIKDMYKQSTGKKIPPPPKKKSIRKKISDMVNRSTTSTFTPSSSGNPGAVSDTASLYSGTPATDKNMIIGSEDVNEEQTFQSYYKYGLLHDELIFLSQITIPNTAANREFLFKKSDTSQVIHRLITMTIVGSGVKPQSDKPEIAEALSELFDNLRGPYQDYNIIDLTGDILRDNILHGYHLSSIVSQNYVSLEDAYDIPMSTEDITAPPSDNTVTKSVGRPTKDSVKQSIQTHRLDMRSIQKVTHPTTGAIKFIQDVYTYMEIPSVKEFYSNKYNPTWKTGLGITTRPDVEKRHVINIKPEQVVYVNLFREPPFATVLDLITHRTWLLWAQKKVGLKYAAPVPIIKLTEVGDEDENDPASRQATMDAVASQLSAIRFGDAIVLDVDQEWVGDKLSSGGNAGFNFGETIDSYDKRIALALGSSMSLFEASGAELATSRTIQDTFLRFISGIRAKLNRAYKLMCYRHLKAMNIPFEKDDFKFIWSPLRDRMLSEVINAVVTFWNSGLVQTMEEARSMAEGVFDLEKLDKEENKTFNQVLQEKEYASARGRGDAEIETQREIAKITMEVNAHAASVLPTPAGPGGGGAKPAKKKNASSGSKENQQGSLSSTGAQPGARSSGPQGDTGKQSVSERDSQLTTSKD